MSNTHSEGMLEVVPEPTLIFRHGQRAEDPRDGLALFGPWDTDRPEKRLGISYAVIGTEEGVAGLRQFLKVIRRGVHLPPREVNARGNPLTEEQSREYHDKDLRLWPPYPGFEAAFHSKLPEEATTTITLDRTRMETAASHADPHLRSFEAVNAYLTNIEAISKREEDHDIIFCIVPDIVYENCRPESRVQSPIGHRTPKADVQAAIKGQHSLFGQIDATPFRLSVDFRRQLKALSMKYGIPIQILQEGTLSLEAKPKRRLTPLSDRAWNITTTAYYKARGRPWKLADVRDGVCYVGTVFRQTGKRSAKSACCAAQMFLQDGDGVVFRGADGRWWSPERKKFELTKQAASDLLRGVLDTYSTLNERPLSEIFLHCRSNVNREAIKGYEEACPKAAKLVIVKIRQARNAMRLFREGDYPVLRGTLLVRSKRLAYLWTSGFKPRLGTYDGWEVPAPLELRLLHGEADIVQVARDVMGLTKLNYNACRLGDSEPVTIGFSDMVGEILVGSPDVRYHNPRFPFYI